MAPLMIPAMQIRSRSSRMDFILLVAVAVLTGCTEWFESYERGLSWQRFVLMTGDAAYIDVLAGEGKFRLVVIERSDVKAGCRMATIACFSLELPLVRVILLVARDTRRVGVSVSDEVEWGTQTGVRDMAGGAFRRLMHACKLEVRFIVIE